MLQSFDDSVIAHNSVAHESCPICGAAEIPGANCCDSCAAHNPAVAGRTGMIGLTATAAVIIGALFLVAVAFFAAMEREGRSLPVGATPAQEITLSSVAPAQQTQTTDHKDTKHP